MLQIADTFSDGLEIIRNRAWQIQSDKNGMEHASCTSGYLVNETDSNLHKDMWSK